MHDGIIRPIDTLISTVAGGSPNVQALDLAYVKKHIRSLDNTEDALVEVWIDAAASYFEQQTGRALLTQTREVWLDAFPFQFYAWPGHLAKIELPHPPLQSVVSVQYVDGDGTVVGFEDGASPSGPGWQVKAPQGPYATRGWIEPIAGASWPIARLEGGAVRIQYVCGYGDTADDIPPLARGVLCYLVAHFDTFRSAVHEARRGQVLELPYGVEMMLASFIRTAMPSQVLRYGFHHPGMLGGGWPWL